MKWEKVKLGDVSTVTSSKRIFANQYVESGIPFYRQKEIILKNSKSELTDLLYISEDLYEQIKRKFGVPQKNDLLITAVGATLGIPYIVGNETFYFKDGNLIWLKDFSKKVNPVYIYFWISSETGQKSIWSRIIGSAQPALTIDFVKQYELEIPERKAQDKIADILSAYDNLIENNQKQIKLLEEAAQRLYKEWFVDLRFPGYENTRVVGGVPEGWGNCVLSDVFSYIRGKSYSSSEISDYDGKILVNLKNIQAWGGYKREVEKRFIGTFKENQSLQFGDIIMAVTDMTQERRLVGHVALVPEFKEEATFSMDLIKIIPYVGISKLFLYSTLRYSGIAEVIAKHANGTNVLHLKPESIMGLPITVPPNEIMLLFENVVKDIFIKNEKSEMQIIKLKEARDRLLPKLMSGELEV